MGSWKLEIERESTRGYTRKAGIPEREPTNELRPAGVSGVVRGPGQRKETGQAVGRKGIRICPADVLYFSAGGDRPHKRHEYRRSGDPLRADPR